MSESELAEALARVWCRAWLPHSLSKRVELYDQDADDSDEAA